MIKLDADKKFEARDDWKKYLNDYYETSINQVATSQGITAYCNKKKVGYWDYDKNVGIVFGSIGNNSIIEFTYRIGGF